MRNPLLISSFALAVLATAVPASAQTFKPREPRPEWAIFGSGVSKTEQRLVLTANFGAGYEDDLSKAAPPPDDGSGLTTPYYTGPFGSAGANLKYSVNKKKVSGAAQFDAYGRNYRDMTDPFVGTYSGSANLSFAVGKHGSLSTSGYAGQFVPNLSPMGAGGSPGVPQTPSDPGAFTTGETYRGFGASANYSHNFTEKFSAYGSYSYYANDSYSSAVENGKYDSQFASAGIRYALGKGLGLRLGYASTFGGFYSAANPLEYRSRTIDAGVDYNQSLSLTRKSTLSFGTGVSGVTDSADTVHYYFVGHVNFSHEIGRTWSAYANVNRDVNFYQTLGQPTVAGWASAGLNGTIGRHVEAQAGFSYWNGASVGTNEQVYDSTSAVASARVGLNRVLAIGASYTYYHYLFSDDVAVPPPGFGRQTDRQVFQISLIVWAPLMTRAPAQSRSANASR